MIILNIANPITILLTTLFIALMIFLGQEIKKSAVVGATLFLLLALLVMHVVQIVTLSEEFIYYSSTLYKCIACDFVFILVTFFGYLWVDDIEAKEKNIKSIDNSLDWFWKDI